jgi:long-chain fatty acid transport protein
MRTSLLSTVIVLLFCAMASADDEHYVNNLIGDRATGMGGAYTAVSDDATGLFYNPAGIVYANGKNLSASVNAYSSVTKKYQGAIAGQDWKRESFTFLPNYFGVVQPLGKFTVGFSYAVPDSSSEDQDQTFTDVGGPSFTYTINFNNEDKTYAIGPSIAAEIGRDLAAGLTLYVHYRSLQLISNTVAADNTVVPLVYELRNTYLEADELGLRPVLGFMWSPVKWYRSDSLSKKFIIDSDADPGDLFDERARCAARPGGYVRAEYSSDAKRKYPMGMVLGAAYFASDRLLLSADVSYHEQIHDEAFTDRKKIVNVALGTEYYVTPTWVFRGGLYTDFASTLKIDPAESGQPEHIDLYSASLSVTRFTRSSSITLGGSYGIGTGSAQLKSGSPEIQKAEETAWTVFLSSSYKY